MKIYSRTIRPPRFREEIKGTTLTLQNQCKSLIELIESSIVNNEPLPLSSRPLFDVDEKSGIARSMVNNTPLHEAFHASLESENSNSQIENTSLSEVAENAALQNDSAVSANEEN